MIFEKTSEKSFFVYNKELEYFFISLEILGDFRVNDKIREVYSEEFIEEIRSKHALLMEVSHDFVKENLLSFLEYLREYEIKDFSLKRMFLDMKSMDQNAWLKLFFVDEKIDFSNAIHDKEACFELYTDYRNEYKGFFGFSELIQNTRWIIEELEKITEEVKTREAERFLEENNSKIEEWKVRIKEALKGKNSEKELVAYSQELFGKNFYHAGPFEKFYFMPSIFLPVKICRWYGKNQFLSLNANLLEAKSIDTILEQIKTLSDNKRYQILQLIKEKGTITGVEIAEKLGLAPSTVSHHMTSLRGMGLIHEESESGIKFYSINKNTIKDCVELLSKTFLI